MLARSSLLARSSDQLVELLDQGFYAGPVDLAEVGALGAIDQGTEELLGTLEGRTTFQGSGQFFPEAVDETLEQIQLHIVAATKSVARAARELEQAFDHAPRQLAADAAFHLQQRLQLPQRRRHHGAIQALPQAVAQQALQFGGESGRDSAEQQGRPDAHQLHQGTLVAAGHALVAAQGPQPLGPAARADQALGSIENLQRQHLKQFHRQQGHHPPAHHGPQRLKVDQA